MTSRTGCALALLLAIASACSREEHKDTKPSPSERPELASSTPPEPPPQLLYLPDGGDIGPPRAPGQQVLPGPWGHVGSRCPPDMVSVHEFCIDRYEFPNVKGVRPMVMQNFYQAQVHCARRGKRAIRGGRPRVRKALYMAALGAIRASARFKAFYAVIAARSGSKNSPSSPSPESSSPFSTPCNATTNHTLETQLQEPRPIRGTPGRADDRAWVEAELKDVGDQALMRARGLATAFPIVRPGLFLSYCGRRSICRPQSG